MKADNEPATNDILQVCQKMKICLKKAKQNKTTKKKGKKVEPRTIDGWGQRVINCATTANVKQGCQIYYI